MHIQKAVFNLMALATWGLQAAILFRMHKKALAREFRVFFLYTIFTLCLSVSLVAIRNYFGFRSAQYFIAYWCGFPIQVVLTFFVIQEVYAKVLYRYEGLRTVSSMIFRWAFMLLVVLAIAAAVSSPAADRDWIYSTILKVDYSTRVVEFGLITLLFVFARTLDLGWRECAFGIAVGTCFYCSTELAAMSLRAHFGNGVAEIHATLKPIVGIITLGIWTTYFYRADNQVRDVKFSSPQLEEWNRAILQFLNR